MVSEKELTHEKKKLDVILQSISDGVIVTNEKGEITLVNKVAEYLTGWKKEEVLGKDINVCYARNEWS